MTHDAFMHFEYQKEQQRCDTDEEGVHGATVIPAPGSVPGTLSNFEPVFAILARSTKLGYVAGWGGGGQGWGGRGVGVPAWEEAVHTFSSGNTLRSSEDCLLVVAVLLLLLLLLF